MILLGLSFFASALQPLALELRQGPLDLAVFYLDDGVVAGDVSAVSAALLHVQQHAASFGLCLNLAKCEVVTPGRAGAADLAAALPATLLRTHDGNDRVLHNFEFLGAAVGDDTFVAEDTRARVQKAMPLLDAIAELPDPQVALRLLRACAGHARLVHSMRCNPPLPQQAALDHFDCLVRGCFSIALRAFTLTRANGCRPFAVFHKPGLAFALPPWMRPPLTWHRWAGVGTTARS